MYDWSVPLCKLKNDPSPATARRVQELLETYNAAPAKTPSTGAYIIADAASMWSTRYLVRPLSASLNQLKPHVQQKQVFADRNPTL